MKKLQTVIAVLVICAFLLFSCKKTEQPTQSGDAPFDFDLYNGDSATMSIYTAYPYKSFGEIVTPCITRYISGKKERVSLSSTEVPAGVIVTFIDSFENTITAIDLDIWFGVRCEMDTSLALGKYSPKIIATSASGVIRVDSLLIIVDSL